MKALKIISFIILVLLAIILIPPAFVNGNYSVEREVTVELPKDDVFFFVKHLKSQDDFSVWNQMDPDMKKSYSGTDGTVGAMYSWSGNKDVGKGEQEIIAIDEGKRVDFELRFLEPWESTDNAWIITEAVDESTTLVKWGFEGKMTYPLKGMMIFMDMEEMLGPDLQKGLNNLKELLESE